MNLKSRPIKSRVRNGEPNNAQITRGSFFSALHKATRKPISKQSAPKGKHAPKG
jgi:hypothetical protein